MSNFSRKEDDNREAKSELEKGYHGDDDYYKIVYDDGTGAGIAFSTEEDAQNYIDKK